MDILSRLCLRYRSPPLLGLKVDGELRLLLNKCAQAATYDEALLPLLETELSVVRQKVEELRSASGSSIKQGLEARMTSLEREVAATRRRIANQNGGGGFRIVSGGVPLHVPRRCKRD